MATEINDLLLAQIKRASENADSAREVADYRAVAASLGVVAVLTSQLFPPEDQVRLMDLAARVDSLETRMALEWPS
jgi:hypothetical protein